MADRHSLRKQVWLKSCRAVRDREQNRSRDLQHGRKIAVIGLGYVGLPVAVAFARSGVPVVGFDIKADRIAELRVGRDSTLEVESSDLNQRALTFESDPASLSACDFFIVTVPTPVDKNCNPDLGAMLKASETVGKAMKAGAIVVYESTVYPGAVEEECVPALERASGLHCGSDFTVGYSPERINPGDKAHRFESIVKVVSAQDPKTLEIVAGVYGSVVKAGIHKASSIKVAEAAKVIENTQRDLNIAFMNELSAILQRLDIDTADVLAAASTKWNFLNFQPGLVGGHCIGVDPFYLTYRAEMAGYHPEVILAGRRINDAMGARVARECLRLLEVEGVNRPTVTILGITFKENVPDIRNSKVIDIVRTLREAGVVVQVADPFASAAETKHEYDLDLIEIGRLQRSDAVILAVGHQDYIASGWDMIVKLLKSERGVVLDVKSKLDRAKKPDGVTLWRA